jgi:tetratricopeptide (TPR) repeat protein/outer membrane biosynthesis protein TonB
MKSPLLNHRTTIFALLLTVAVVWLSISPGAGAQNKRLPKRAGHINDFAEVLDAAMRARLETVLENLKEKSGVDFVVVTVKTTDGEDLYEYSLKAAEEWNVGSPSGIDKSVLIVLSADTGKFFSQVTRGARLYLPEGLIGEMGLRMRQKIESAGFSEGLLTGVRTFVDATGEIHNFNFAALDPRSTGMLIAEQQRPRTVASPVSENTASPTTAETPAPSPSETPTPEATPSARETATPSAQPSETPAASPQPSETAKPSEIPSPVATQSATPLETPSAQPSPTTPSEVASPQASPNTSPATETVADNSARPAKTPLPDRRTNTPASPEDEKEQVELTLTLPLDKRIDALKSFIASHPTSAALPRANELLVVAHAMLGDQKMQARDAAGGLEQFRAAIAEAPADMSDRLFNEVIARIPMNLFVRGQRDAAYEAAKQAETLAKGNAKRLLALEEFYLAIENPTEAGRLAEAALQLAPDSAAAHQALGAARHIDLRLDEAEKEYARALELDPKSSVARVVLADLKRASGKTEEALALYREQLQTEPKNNRARAGMILSLFELGKKEEAETEFTKALQDEDQSRNLPLLVGAAYWFIAHNNADRGFDLAQKAIAIEPRYPWAQIALERALIANKRPIDAEAAVRFARQYGRFPTVDYEVANVLSAMGLYDEAGAELSRSFSLKNGEIETKLAGRIPAHAPSFTELLAPERRAAIFQNVAADSEANARRLKALMAFNAALEQPSPNEDDVLAIAQEFIKGDDAMRTYRQVYVAGKLVKNGIALMSVVELMDQAMSGVDAALAAPAATVAVQPEELSDVRARALAQGNIPAIPDAPRAALAGILRGRIEDLAGLALFKADKPADAVTRLRRAVVTATEGTPLWRSSMWHLGTALEASGKSDQALLYYIKSYINGPPDPARRSVIENVYKKVNGTLDGLDDKIGPGFAAASASPTPTP